MDFLDFLGADAPAGADPVVAAESDSDDEVAPAASGPSALALSLARLRAHVNRDATQQLEKQGFVVLDNVFENTLVSRFASEISALHAAGHTGLNSTAFVTAHGEGELPSIARLIPKPGVFETELTEPVRTGAAGTMMPELVALYNALPGVEAHLASLLPSWELSVGQQRSSIKLQMNTGGSGPGRAFPFHYDSPGGSKDSRRLTMLLYLNSSWQPGDGGELVLQPFLTPAVRIAPKAGRMVLFKSDTLLHRVLPSTAQRRCLTIWMHRKQAPQAKGDEQSAAAAAAASAASSGGAAASPSSSSGAAASSSSAADADAFAALWMSRLNDPAWQRVLARAVYLDDWRQSFLQAHGRATDVDGEAAADPQDGGKAAAPAVCYVNGGVTAASAGTDSGEGVQQRGAEPLVESLEADAARLEAELAGTGILELLRHTAEEHKGKIIVV